MIFIVYILTFVIVLMGILLVILYRNEERAISRKSDIEGLLKTEKAKNKELERKIFELDCEREQLNDLLENEKELSLILDEKLDVYKDRVKELEGTINSEGKGAVANE